MYLGLLLLSVVAYGLQGVLVGQMARRYDLLWVTTARGIGLLIIMAPLGLLAPAEAWARLPGLLPLLAIACVAALVANLLNTWAMRHLPMAIAIALCQGCSALGTLILEVRTSGAVPPAAELACVAVILAGVGVLAWSSSRGSRPAPGAKPWIGVLASLGFGACMASALIPLGMVSRQADPFLAAWCWEGGIGLAGAAALAGRRLAGIRVPRPPLRDLLRIGAYSSPTLVGTGGYTYATTLGSLSIAGGVLSLMMVSTAIFARIFYRERLDRRQWLAIGLTLAFLVGLGFVRAAAPPAGAPPAAAGG